MFIDAFGLLSDAQAFTGSDEYTTNTVDLGNVTPKRDLGAGEPMAMAIQVDVAADFTTGDETYEFRFVQSDNANLSSEDTLVSRTIAASLLTAGSLHVINIPPGAITKRYIGGRGILGGTTPTITATIWIAPLSMIERRKDYAKGYTIS